MVCGRCDAIVAGDAIQCAQCGWFVPDDVLARRELEVQAVTQPRKDQEPVPRPSTKVVARVLASIGVVFGEIPPDTVPKSGKQPERPRAWQCWRMEPYVRAIDGHSSRSTIDCPMPEPRGWHCSGSTDIDMHEFEKDAKALAQRMAALKWGPTQPHSAGNVSSWTWERICLLTEPIAKDPPPQTIRLMRSESQKRRR
jgi:hypothetical protein